MLPRDRLLNSSTALGERYVHKSLPTQRHILPGNWNWESTATADYLVRETTWLTSMTGGTSQKYVLAYRYQLEDEYLGGKKKPARYSTIFRWELILIWEYLRQVTINRVHIMKAVQASSAFDNDPDSVDRVRLERWWDTVSLKDLCFGNRLNELERFESLGQIPRTWKDGHYRIARLEMGFPLDCEGFEVGFFARCRKLLDGYALDGPSGYPLEQTRMYLQGDVAVRHRFLNPNKLLEAVTRWDDWIYHDVSVRKCIDRSERIQDYTAEMTSSSSGGTMISGSSISEINARLALEEDKLNQDQEPLLLPDFPTAYAEKPASSKLIFLYEVERSTWNFSPEFWGRHRLICQHRSSLDTPLRLASERYERREMKEKEALEQEFRKCLKSNSWDAWEV
ncbi:hypothetical protein FFLO_00070 [Filobasidium floriforme]|uniref:Uncharacterized protein n=1 Tax=Filobasidium floriforme TaxID=5210 RepID=A0A8K0JWY9_9TREE|nr:hypothetical protein FFLO_00070 [Filobasidium floriforme]